jgi:hypothetical protein
MDVHLSAHRCLHGFGTGIRFTSIEYYLIKYWMIFFLFTINRLVFFSLFTNPRSGNINTPLSPDEQAEVIKTLNILQLYSAAQKEEPKVEKIDLSKPQDVLDKLKAASEWDAESVSSEA